MPSTQQVFLRVIPALGTVTTAALEGNQRRDEEGMGSRRAGWGMEGDSPNGMKMED